MEGRITSGEPLASGQRFMDNISCLVQTAFKVLVINVFGIVEKNNEINHDLDHLVSFLVSLVYLF